MKEKYIFAFLVVLAILATLSGIYHGLFWLQKSGEILFFLPLFAYYFRRLPSKNLNFYAFFGCVVAATAFSVVQEVRYVNQIRLCLWLIAYVFLVREAIKHTIYERGSKFTVLYFAAVVVVYAYLLSLHITEIERSVSDTFTFSLYLVYYINLLVFAIAGLVYYLNSFSRKSVFSICLALSFIFADILRDMVYLYFPDMSVEMVGSLIKFAAIKLVFLFFVTREKKLRLFHMV